MMRYRYFVLAATTDGDECGDSDFAATKKEAVTYARSIRKNVAIARISIYPSNDYAINYDHEVWGWKRNAS